uniref:S8 family serine peptidase n=1 Tax=Flavobacterium sp. TaxID=239 RepID=UPI00404B6BFC
MKNYFLNKRILVVLVAVLGYSAYAQTPEQRAEIVKNYDLVALQELSEKFAKEQKENYALALIEANKRNMPTIIEDENSYSELIGISPDGSLLYNTTSNQGSAITARANHLYPNGSLGLNILGQEMNVGVWDSNHPRLTHNDFNDRAFVLDGSGVNQSLHATHVTGTIISSGTNNPQGRGIAPSAYAWVNDWNNDFSEMSQQAGFGLLMSNHSYGLIAGQLSLYFFGAYTSLSRSTDEVTFAAPYYQPVYAAGNDRDSWNEINPDKNQNDLITGRSGSKNGITVAAVANVANYVSPNSVNMSSFSNYGPMDDFRIKPDISAKGTSVLSTSNESNTSYATLNGTSMAAPAVTAVLALLQQHYNNVNSVFMRAATSKGLILHTADEAGPSDGPDHMFGWGLVNAKKSAEIITNANVTSLILENTLNQNQVYSRNIYSAGTVPLEVSISWTDRAGQANSGVVDLNTPVLVNDLDVRLTRNNDVFFPWKLTPSFSSPIAVKDDNNVDPFEKIEVLNPLAGIYTITVSHKNNLTGGSQDYSLIVSGVDENLDNDSFENQNSIVLYPNPVNDVLNIANINHSDIKSISIIDMNGRVIINSSLFVNTNNNIVISTVNLQSGVYFLQIQDTKGMMTHHKFIKAK